MTRLSHSIFTSLREASEGSFGNMDRFQTGNRGLSFEAAILGAYWGKELLLAEQQGRICDVPVNTDLPVHTAWDIGVDDAMAIWCFQVYPDHLDIVDYSEGHGQGFDHYCAWLDERGYHGTDWFPPDVKVREAGAPGARTRFETLVLLRRKPG